MYQGIQIKKVRPNARIPKYARQSDAGLDLSACIEYPFVLSVGSQSVLIPTGLAIYIGGNHVAALILPRSGSGHRGLVLGNGVGVIDAGYQGELLVSAWNRSSVDIVVAPNERIAQLVFIPIVRASWLEVSEFTDTTDRGTGGFGST